MTPEERLSRALVEMGAAVADLQAALCLRLALDVEQVTRQVRALVDVVEDATVEEPR